MKSKLHIITFTLVIIGALNWGLIAFFSFNIVGTAFGAGTLLEKLINALIGISAVIIAASHLDDCRTCQKVMGNK